MHTAHSVTAYFHLINVNTSDLFIIQELQRHKKHIVNNLKVRATV